jgi:hypothetical protein
MPYLVLFWERWTGGRQKEKKAQDTIEETKRTAKN